MSRNRKVSRRDFARASMAAGAAAMALPSTLLAAKEPAAPASTTKEAGAAAARRMVSMPPEIAYGGMSAVGRDLTMLSAEAVANQTAPNPTGEWRDGMTMAAKYYVDEEHYLNDEQFVGEHFWQMADHESRIPNPGDYFLFQYGRAESVIVLRDKGGEVRGFHNVCRHRGSRLCIHEEELPSLARKDGKPEDPKLSVVQLGSSGNSPVFRCPYHAWTYDLSGKLIHFPPGMPTGFDPSQHGMHPAHVRTVGGFIYVNFARREPPDFDSFVAAFKTVCDEYGTKDLKVVARASAPTRGNWKLVLENFRECYHCLPSHTKSYSSVHGLYSGGSSAGATITAQQREQIDAELARHGHARDRQAPSPEPNRPQSRDQLVQPPSQGMGMGGGNRGSHLKVGFASGTLDGKPVGPLLPGRKEWTHSTRAATTGFSTGYIQVYDDHVACVRFTPRGVDLTDAELFWLVAPNTNIKPADIERMKALWFNTYREDRWIVENNHHGIRSGRYNFNGPQPYAAGEGGPSGLVKWYLREVASRMERPTNTAG